jgi:AhpD family alkylhydroperoxidase
MAISHEQRDRQGYKRTFSYADMYRVLIDLPGALRTLKRNRETQMVDSAFIERLMLAVTEVNGCAVCSYAHTRMALKEGLSEQEIADLLNGDTTHVLPEEAKGIVFAQHVADTVGRPDREAYRSIEVQYGKERAQAILAATQVILVGNLFGIPYSALLSRLRGEPYRGSSLWYELSMLLWGGFCIPCSLLHALVRTVGRTVVQGGATRS